MKTTKEIDRKIEIVRKNLKEISEIVSANGGDPFFVLVVGVENESGSISFNYETEGTDLCLLEDIFDVLHSHTLTENIDDIDRAIGDKDPSDPKTWIELGNVNLN